MVHLPASERPALAAASLKPFSVLARWFAAAKLHRARRRAYRSLLDYDVARLDDLGINRQDLFEAMARPGRQPGLRLAQKRADSARNWLDR